tara:strand:- start:61 stop:846 length:786 start_codon:yes stop_codon:yes gene_type:complete
MRDWFKSRGFFKKGAQRTGQDGLVEGLADLPASTALGYIYRLTFPDGMQYVGQTVDLAHRIQSHRNGNKCPKVQEWKRLFGWASVQVDVLERVPHSRMNQREIALIAKHQTLWPRGLNKTPGGDTPDAECVRATWRDPDVRARHTAGRKAAWADPKKRANIMKGRAKSSKVAAAKAAKKQNAPAANAKRTVTWEAQREKRLAGLTGKARAQKLARLNRDRERQRRYAEAKRTQAPLASSASKQSTHGQYDSDDEEGDWDSG